MGQLNKTAAEIMMKFDVHACTDVTGFGLIGHLHEMCKASGINVELKYTNIPYFKEALDFITANIIPGGSINNLDYYAEHVSWQASVSRNWKILLNDAQTSGGLLISLPHSQAVPLKNTLAENGLKFCSVIGTITEKGVGTITIKD